MTHRALGADADFALDPGVVGQLGLLFRGDQFQCADEAGGIAGREQLLRVGAIAAGATQFLGRRQFEIDGTVGGGGTAVAAASNSRFGTIEDVIE